VNLPQASIIDQIADHRDELLNENRHLKQRIKRLEEAGDEMYRWITVKRLCSIDCTEAWNKAKEAKL